MTAQLTADEFDRMAEASENIDAYLDWGEAMVQQPLVVHVSVSLGRIAALDARATAHGKTRDACLHDLVDALLATA